MGKCVMCPHCGGWFFPEKGVTLDDCPKCGRTVEVPPDHIADTRKMVQPALEKCEGCDCEHDEIHNPTDTCATCNGGSRYHMPKPAPAPLPEKQENECEAYIARRVSFRPSLTSSQRIMLELEIERAWVTSRIAAQEYLSDLTRRLAESEAKKEQVVRWHDDLAKKCRDLLDDAVKYTQHRHQLEARAEAAEAFKSRVMAWARGDCQMCEYDTTTFVGDLKCGECVHGGGLLDRYRAKTVDNWTPPQAWEAGE